MHGDSQRTKCLAALLAALLLLTICCGGARKPPETPDETPEAQAVENPTGTGPSPEPYRLVAGDRLAVTYYLGELNWTSKNIVLRPDGFISLPLVDDVKAAGLTMDQLAELIRQEYAGVYRHPQIGVKLRWSTGGRVYIGGEVFRPRVLPLRSATTAYDAIVRAGGFKVSGKKNTVMILRKESPTSRTILELDLSKPEHLLDPLKNVFLQPGDIVLVPKTGITKTRLWMNQYIYDTLSLTLYFSLSNYFNVVKP